MKRAAVTEQQLAEVAVGWLEDLGADVYQEVEISGGIADIVARVRAELWIVEVKTSLSLALVAQAAARRRLAHRVVIAAPATRNLRDVVSIVEEIGLGLLEISPAETFYGGTIEPRVREVLHSRRWNTRPVALAERLKPEHKTHAKAGAVGAGGRWTVFRGTCEALARVVKAEPRITLKEAIEKTQHHYSSSRSAVDSLHHWIEAGKVPGVRLVRSHGTHGTLLVEPVEVTR